MLLIWRLQLKSLLLLLTFLSSLSQARPGNVPSIISGILPQQPQQPEPDPATTLPNPIKDIPIPDRRLSNVGRDSSDIAYSSHRLFIKALKSKNKVDRLDVKFLLRNLFERYEYQKAHGYRSPEKYLILPGRTADLVLQTPGLRGPVRLHEMMNAIGMVYRELGDLCYLKDHKEKCREFEFIIHNGPIPLLTVRIEAQKAS